MPPTRSRAALTLTHGPNIRQLTDVSGCNLQQYLCCNRTVKCQQLDRIPPGLAAQSDLC
jgi:hypothetical protein